MVTENPIQFTTVSAVPLYSAGAFCATRVENNGESAMTTNPQKIKKANKRKKELDKKTSGERRQHKPEQNKAEAAIFLVPHFWERYPPIIQANPPSPIIKKDHKGILIDNSGCNSPYEYNMIGTNAQKAYNSHICPK